MATANHLLPANEAARLQTLHDLNLQDALREPLFQRLVDLAAQVFNLPISFLSLVDSERVDFAVTHGIGTLADVPREETLCSLPVRQAGTFVIDDVQAGGDSVHRQTADKLGLVFYAGSPLLVQGEYAIGALCVSDTSRREFSEAEQQVLETLAALVSRAFVAWQQARQQPDGQPQWQHQQEVAVQEVGSLEALIRYLTSRNGQQLPATPTLLGVVQRRLADVTELLLTDNPPA